MTFRDVVDEAPKRGGRKTTTRRAPVSTRSLRKEIDGFISFLNGIIFVIAPTDALDSIELAALVKAIDEETKINPRFRRGIEALLKVTSGGSLWMVVSIIAARRAARHGAIGRMGPIVDEGGAFVLSTINAEPSEAAQTMGDIMSMFRDPPLRQDEQPNSPDTTTGNGAAT